ncbi:hypothetical protein IAT38_005373 [Cryptococcus sp. DSM 104549]
MSTSSAPRKVAVILGVGPGISAAIATLLSSTHSLVLLSRSLPDKLPTLNLPSSIPASNLLALSSDGSAASLERALAEVDAKWPGAQFDVGIYNVNHAFELKGFLDRTEADLRAALESGVISGFNFAQALLPRFLSNPDPASLPSSDPASRLARGTLIFTGATMSLRSGAKFSTLAPTMFARRALAQSLAREFGPQGVHVAHVVIDAVIDTPRAIERFGEAGRGGRMKTEEGAQVYLDLINQKRSAWTQELDLR